MSMKRGLGLLVVVACAACPGATTPPAPGAQPAGPAAITPTHAPLDVPIVNASRGEAFLGARWTHVVWTGTEAVFFETTPGRLMSNLWVGRMDAQGHELSRVQVPLDHEVDVGSYPVWVDGTIAAVFSSYLTSHWIRVRPDGTLVADVKLTSRPGWRLYATHAALGDTGLAVQASIDHGQELVDDLGPLAIDAFDIAGRRGPSAELRDCRWVSSSVITSWGVVVQCANTQRITDAGGPRFVSHPTTILGLRGGREIWRHELPTASLVTLGSDGERTLLVYEVERRHGVVTDTLNGSDSTVRIELLDDAGKVLTSSVVSSIAPDLREQNLLWTGTEYAAVRERWIYRYSADGHEVGVWDLEPRCTRDFHATGLAWTGASYLVTGYFFWNTCVDIGGRPIGDDDRLKLVAPGLRWDPAADALQPPPPADW